VTADGSKAEDKGNNRAHREEERLEGHNGDSEPESAPVQEARLAFEAGDYRRVRQLIRELGKSNDPATRQTAQELARRVQADPAILLVLLLCAALFIGIACVYVFR